MNQQTFDRATAYIFLGLVAILILSFLGRPTVSLLDALVEASAVSPTETVEAKAHERADLAAQRSMAFAAWLMLFTAIVQMVVAAVGIWLVRKTLVETQRSVAVAEDGVRAMKEVSDLENRPWLSIAEIALRKDKYQEMQVGGKAQYYELICNVKNHGHSPAFDVVMFAGAFLCELKSFEDEIVSLTEFGRNLVSSGNSQGEAIFPGQNIPMHHFVAVQDNEIAKARERSRDHFPDAFSPAIVICVAYRSSRFEGAKVSRTVVTMVTRSDGMPIMVTSLDDDIAITSAFRTYAD